MRAAQIPVVADLPGVGRNLQDHIYSGLIFLIDDQDTIKPTLVFTPDKVASYFLEGRGESIRCCPL